MIRRALICNLLALSTLAHAASWRVPLAEAADALEQARTEATGERGRCRDAVFSGYDATLGRVEQLRTPSREQAFAEVRLLVSALVDRASASRCPPQVLNALLLARSDVEAARFARFGGVAPLPNPPPPPAAAQLIEIAPLRISPGGRREGNPGVRVELQSLRVRGLNGHTFQVAFNVRQEQGGWGEWTATRDLPITTDDFTASNVHQALFGVRELFPNGPPPSDRFVAHVGIFENGREVSSRDESFQLPPGLFGPPPPGFVGGTLPVVRDCGTGEDPGCAMQRGGQFPMEKETFEGLLVSLKTTMSPFDRRDMLKDVLAGSFLTAKQFAVILGVIQSNFRLEAAQVAVPRLVNPKAALGLSSQFTSPFDQRDYVKLVSQQP